MKPTDKNKDIPSIIAEHRDRKPHPAHPIYTKQAILLRVNELHEKASERYAMHLDELEKPENEFIHQMYLDYDEFTYAIKYLIEKLPA
jgi:uncharacterized protein YnzC (UPF0291/DUF896 family)